MKDCVIAYLSNSNSVLQVKYAVPPPSGYEDGFSRLLDQLINLEVMTVFLTNAWQHVHEVVDRFIIFACRRRQVIRKCKLNDIFDP